MPYNLASSNLVFTIIAHVDGNSTESFCTQHSSGTGHKIKTHLFPIVCDSLYSEFFSVVVLFLLFCVTVTEVEIT